jgi:two-component system, cell cycle sensor histidine kinase and response regulator CckA
LADDRLSILLVDASEDDAHLIRDLLAQGESDIPQPELVQALTADDGRRLARDSRFDLVIVDSRIGDADGLELVRQLRAGRLETPIVVLTDAGGEQSAVETLRAGATDYLGKTGLSVYALRRSMRYALDVARQARLRREAEGALRLREEQLLETQRLETVATLSGGVAHEFNNLLNIVIGYGDMLRRRLPAGDPLHRHVDHILQASEKAAALTRQLLAFSRNQVLQPTVLDAGQLLRDMEPVVRSVVGRRVEVVVEAGAASGGCIKADRGQMEHSLLSIALNAKDAMPEGGRLTLAVRDADAAELAGLRDPERTAGPYLAISLTDNGRGMTPEIQARALEPFFTTKGRANARGLGLSTVYGIVRQSGGQLRLQSEPGTGTQVTIYLPRVDGAGNFEAAAMAAAGGGGERILLVDDDAAMRTLLSESLRAAGYSVEVAASGSDALRAAAAPGPEIDLLLTDVMMPGMSGTELAARLRELRPGARVVYMSGATQEALRQRDNTIDAPFLWKPFSTEELTHTVRQVLDESRAR